MPLAEPGKAFAEGAAGAQALRSSRGAARDLESGTDGKGVGDGFDLGSLLLSMGIDDDANAIAPEPLVVDGIEMPTELLQIRSLLESRAKCKLNLQRAKHDASTLEISPVISEEGRRQLRVDINHKQVTQINDSSPLREVALLEVKSLLLDECMLDFLLLFRAIKVTSK